MAEHGTMEYATAEGNDMPAHEAGYESFLHFSLVGTIHTICIVIGLAIGGVMGHWLLALTTILIAVIGVVPALASRSNKVSYVSFALCVLLFLYAATLTSH